MPTALTNAEVQAFIENGFVRIDNAFSKEWAEAGRDILWKKTGCDPHDPSTWTKPVIRLGGYADEPFQKAVNTPILHAAYDQLVGAGRWEPRYSLGGFPIRFPHPDDPGDTGWHVDASFEGSAGSWNINVFSQGRALLMLFLFSDVDIADAPTRILVGSHLDVPKLLAPAGEEGLSFMALAQQFEASSLNRELALATGEAGTVYLCHPFLIHAAQPHRGTTPKFMAQPPLYPAAPLQLQREDESYSPVEIAIRMGLGW
ncbi:MAG: phytanoyl-CoA dioxygenase family protein [Saprospiraceae bacterium]